MKRHALTALLLTSLAGLPASAQNNGQNESGWDKIKSDWNSGWETGQSIGNAAGQFMSDPAWKLGASLGGAIAGGAWGVYSGMTQKDEAKADAKADAGEQPGEGGKDAEQEAARDSSSGSGASETARFNPKADNANLRTAIADRGASALAALSGSKGEADLKASADGMRSSEFKDEQEAAIRRMNDEEFAAASGMRPAKDAPAVAAAGQVAWDEGGGELAASPVKDYTAAQIRAARATAIAMRRNAASNEPGAPRGAVTVQEAARKQEAAFLRQGRLSKNEELPALSRAIYNKHNREAKVRQLAGGYTGTAHEDVDNCDIDGCVDDRRSLVVITGRAAMGGTQNVVGGSCPSTGC